jgi:hypothetical protein
LATDCTIEHGEQKISIIKETCISHGLLGQSGAQTDYKKKIEFNWMSFMLLGKEERGLKAKSMVQKHEIARKN